MLNHRVYGLNKKWRTYEEKDMLYVCYNFSIEINFHTLLISLFKLKKKLL